jgi:hypothetical protein
LVDVLLPEFYQRNDLIPLGLKHRLTKAYFDDGPIWGNVRHSVRHDARHHLLRGTRVLLVNCVANLAAPVLLDLCAMDFDPTGTEELAETFQHIRSIQEVQADAELVRYAALLHSRRTHELFPDRYDEAFEGMYRLLFESHMPFEIINDAGVERGALKEYKVLVMADVVSLSDETADRIRRAVNDGLGLVGTYMTGLVDENGTERHQPALADLFGFELNDVTGCDTAAGLPRDAVIDLSSIDGPIFHYGSARTSHPLAQGLPERGFFSFRGGFVVCRCEPDTQVIADIHTLDAVRLNARSYNRRGIYPGAARWPLAIVRECGDGRVAYFATQAEAEKRRAYAPELEALMVRSVLWAGGLLPLETPDCPRSVEVRLFHSRKRHLFQIVLVNLTTNPLVRAGSNPGVIRYITPQKGLRLRLRTDVKVKTLSSLVGVEVQHKVEDGTVLIDLPLLDLYDSIVVEYI